MEQISEIKAEGVKEKGRRVTNCKATLKNVGGGGGEKLGVNPGGPQARGWDERGAWGRKERGGIV